MGDFISNVLDLFQSALAGLHDLFVPLTPTHAWGLAIIALTLIVRILLLPLAVKQIRSMRAMQALQPQIKELQKKHKVDRELAKKDPEKYRAKKAKLNEEMMALYQREKVNPAASCLPLLAQAPIFLALFRILQGDRAAALEDAQFYFFTSQAEDGLTTIVSGAGWPGWLLIALMAGTMFVTQKQMMARQAASGADNPMAQQQKILLYVMPGFLALISLQLPLGVLLYWVTTNLFQAGQQWFMLREVQHEVEEGTLAQHKGGEAAAGTTPRKTDRRAKPNPGATSSGKADVTPAPEDATPNGSGKPGKPGKGGRKKGGVEPGEPGPTTSAPSDGPSGNAANGSGRKRDHLPRRGDRR